jgi:hypothetical protein
VRVQLAAAVVVAGSGLNEKEVLTMADEHIVVIYHQRWRCPVHDSIFTGHKSEDCPVCAAVPELPAPVMRLSKYLDDTNDRVLLDDPEPISVGNILKVDDELMSVINADSFDAPVVVRAVNDSIAASHPVGAPVLISE